MTTFYGIGFRGRLRAGEGADDYSVQSVLEPGDFSDEGGGTLYESEADGASVDLRRPPPDPPPPAPPQRQSTLLDDGASSASGRYWAALNQAELLQRLQSPFDPRSENVEGFEGRVQRAAAMLELRGQGFDEERVKHNILKARYAAEVYGR